MTMSRLTLGSPGVASPGVAVPAASASPRLAGLKLFLEGEDLTLGQALRAGTFALTDNLETADTLTFLYQALAGGVHLRPGLRIVLRLDGVNLFQGTIDAREEARLPSAVALETRVEATDVWAILERRIVTENEPYTGQTAGFIVQDLIATYAADESLTTNSVQDGPTLATWEVKAYTSLADAIRKLAEAAAFTAFVDANRDLHFIPRTAQPAPFVVADPGAFGVGTFGGGAFGVGDHADAMPAETGVRVTESRRQYRNRQTVRYGAGLAQAVTVDDLDAQAERATVEGGSGIYHAVDEDEDLTAGLAQARAEALIRRFATIPTEVRFTTRRRGLRAGQLLTIGLAAHDVAGDFLITSVKLQDRGRQNLVYTVTATSHEHAGGPEAFWRRAVGMA